MMTYSGTLRNLEIQTNGEPLTLSIFGINSKSVHIFGISSSTHFYVNSSSAFGLLAFIEWLAENRDRTLECAVETAPAGGVLSVRVRG